MPTNNTLLMGAVAYDAKVVTIWDGFQRYFARRGLAFDYVLYSNYERQVEAARMAADRAGGRGIRAACRSPLHAGHGP